MCLRRLRSFGACETILSLYYMATIESVSRYGTAVWYRNLPVQAKARLLRLVNTCSKLIGNQTLSSLQEVFHNSVQKLALKISTDSTQCTPQAVCDITL